MSRVLETLRRANRGATIVEFAIISPVLFALMMGLGELSYQAYVKAILTGAIQKAGRDSTIQGATARSAEIDEKVMGMVRTVAKNGTFSSTRKSYSQFGQVAPEPFNDGNGNGFRDVGECFSDVNANGTWDMDPGAAGQGGASDVTVYTVTVTYLRLFPVAQWFGGGRVQSLSATTILKNQPYAAQTTVIATNICA